MPTDYMDRVTHTQLHTQMVPVKLSWPTDILMIWYQHIEALKMDDIWLEMILDS